MVFLSFLALFTWRGIVLPVRLGILLVGWGAAWGMNVFPMSDLERRAGWFSEEGPDGDLFRRQMIVISVRDKLITVSRLLECEITETYRDASGVIYDVSPPHVKLVVSCLTSLGLWTCQINENQIVIYNRGSSTDHRRSTFMVIVAISLLLLGFLLS